MNKAPHEYEIWKDFKPVGDGYRQGTKMSKCPIPLFILEPQGLGAVLLLLILPPFSDDLVPPQFTPSSVF